MDHGWYLSYDGQQHGPHDPAAVRSWYASSQLPNGTLLWRPGDVGWTTIESTLGPLPPPPPRTAPGPAVMTAAGTAPASPAMAAPATSSRASASPFVDADGYASVLRRLGGFVLDVLILWGALLAVSVVVQGLSAIGLPGIDMIGGMALVGLFLLMVVWPLLGIGRLGQSYGKHLAGVRVVSTHDGRPIGGGGAFARQIVQNIGLYALGLGWLWALWDPKRQTWHDKAVSSVVLVADNRTIMSPAAHLAATFRRPQ